MDEYIYIIFYFRTREEFYHLARVQQTLALLEQQELHIYSRNSESHDYDAYLAILYDHFRGTKQEQTRLTTAGISAILQQEIQEFVSQQKDELRISAYPVSQRGSEVSLSIYADLRYFQFSVREKEDPGANEHGLANYHLLLELLKELYRIWRPLLVYKFSWEHGAVNIGWDEIRALDIPVLYAINFFAPELVGKWGREKLLAAPAWIVEELDDGGVLLVPEEPTSLFSPEHSLQQVARHLNMQPHARGTEEDKA